MERGDVLVRMKAEIMSHRGVSLSAADVRRNYGWLLALRIKAMYVCILAKGCLSRADRLKEAGDE